MISQIEMGPDGEPYGTFEDGAEWAIEAMGEILGVDANAYSWDAATEEWEGDVRAVMHNMLYAALGEEAMDQIMIKSKLEKLETET